VTWRTAYTGVHTNALLKDLLQYHGASGLGHTYRYTNLGYNIAGLVVDEVTGGTWQDAMSKNVLAPLRMSSTTPYLSRVDPTRLAQPYIRSADGVQRVRYAKADGNMHAAGGLATTAADLAKWLEVQINQGSLDGRQVLPRHVVAETQRLQASMDGKRGEFKTVGYALGWSVGLQGNDTILVHGGTFSAFRAEIAFDRRTRVGIAVVTNEPVNGGGAAQFLLEYTLDRARDPEAARRKYGPKLAELPSLMERIQGQLAEERARRASRQHALNHPLDGYAGTYESPGGGVMTWSVRDGRLWAEIGVLQSVAEVYDHTTDRLRVELEPGMGKVVTFRFADGRAAAMEFDGLEYARRRP
jgi:CubicO group peptidase (beta-lactamase class C family)